MRSVSRFLQIAALIPMAVLMAVQWAIAGNRDRRPHALLSRGSQERLDRLALVPPAKKRMPLLTMKWIVVNENGKRYLAMRWSKANTQRGRNRDQTCRS